MARKDFTQEGWFLRKKPFLLTDQELNPLLWDGVREESFVLLTKRGRVDDFAIHEFAQKLTEFYVGLKTGQVK